MGACSETSLVIILAACPFVTHSSPMDSVTGFGPYPKEHALNNSRAAIREAILAWDSVDGEDRWEDARLDALAIPHFAFQFEHNLPYRRFCQGRGITPETLTSFRDIPSVPTDVFKQVRLTVASPTRTIRTFRTSGTTLGQRGEHHFEDLSTYAASLQGPFWRQLFPDRAETEFFILAPDSSNLPDSSLYYMFDELVGEQATYFFTSDADGNLTFDLEGLLANLERVQRDATPVTLLGTAFGFMALFDGAPEHRFSLAPGSRLMETGGFKGKSREVSRETLYAMFHEHLGIPRTHCVSEYSMTELSSQAYTPNLRLHTLGETPTTAPLFVAPPWARLEVVDPLSLKPIDEPGQVGLVRWFDLANTESVMMVQTSDRGTLDELGRLTLLGRAPDAELRGCSLAIEEITGAGDGSR